ncbi:P-type conjugative transfer protein TrbL, partial [Paracoccus sp. PXZ]
MGGVASATASGAISPLRRMLGKAADGIKSSYASGAQGSFSVTGGTSTMGTAGGASSAAGAAPTDGAPQWAQKMRQGQTLSRGLSIASHAIRSGDNHAGGASINLSERNR